MMNLVLGSYGLGRKLDDEHLGLDANLCEIENSGLSELSSKNRMTYVLLKLESVCVCVGIGAC